MQTSFTAVIEQANEYRENFITEPYECAWALEARWFINVLEFDGEVVSFEVQISGDGLTWCDEGSSLVFTGPGLQSIPLTNFGGWLRLRSTVNGTAKVLIHLALKG